MTTDTDHFAFERDFAAAPDRMWHLLTSDEGRRAWGAPGETTLTTLASDFRVGGEDRHRCGPEEAPEFESITRWYHIAGPSDAVYSEQIEAGGMALGTSLVTFRVSPKGSGSHVSFSVAVSSFVGAEMIGEFRAGWDGTLEKLDALGAQ